MAKQPDYGIDAPKFVRNLFLFTFFFFGIALVIPDMNRLLFISLLLLGLLCLAEGLLMLLYAKKGKFSNRDRILSLIRWNGNEQVLDVGTGSGLLAIGAAKRLNSGKAIGIDIWNNNDLSRNSAGKALTNAQLENVSDKVDIQEGDVLAADFPENTFDVVVSNLCIHNVGGKANRDIACQEIHRVLKKNGTAIIADLAHSAEYLNEFQRLGMSAQKVGRFFPFQPLTIIKATKN
jgi:arsenite methyltransferase